MIPTTGEITMVAHLLVIGIGLGAAEALESESWMEDSIVEATT
jgi:hypothetical protein